MNTHNRALGSALAMALACGWATPAMAQTADGASVAEELAAMRAQMEAMAQRIAELEGELAETDTAVDAVTRQVAATPVPVASEKPPVDVSWKGAPEFKGEGGWTFKPRGRINLDAGFVNAPDSTSANDGFGSEARRIRLGVQGSMPGGFGYKVEADLAGDEVALTDAILTYKDGDLKLTAGQHNNFQSLEELSSSLNTSFIERAAFTDAFGFQRRVGVSAEFSPNDVLIQAGLFTGNSADLPAKDWSADGRFVYMPKLGSTQLHLGASAHLRSLESGSTVRYRQRPLVHFTSDRFINTGNLSADSEFGLGLEAAAISGPFHVSAETYWQKVDRGPALANPTFFGGSIEAGYFLTKGDSRGYKGGTFDRVKPANPVGEGGIGAVQINARYDHLDLNDAGIIGGTQNSYQASLIWTMTDYTRLLINYARLNYDDAALPAAGGNRSYSVDAVGIRAQIDF
ncbi:porin [Pontixanthobacter gangjinensis]|uniref:Phosphate-selective porin OprO and OprP n=1 Tax=Pontixanthobacter gangjinensis TaxID=1028742 RepID=A0A6I4SMG3_9SPHN|nr:porin [Pontixanthobacter gangjinensis]MXO55942.1 hypothetical protein [Pontixanthobacter gangjinensis]